MSLNRSFILLMLFSLLFISVLIPAHWAGELLKKTDSPLVLQGLSGTLWSGQATQGEIHGQGQRWRLGTFSWALEPLSLLSLSPCAVVSSTYQRQRVDASLCLQRDGSWSVTDAAVEAPASVLNTWSPAPIKGQLELTIDTLVFSAQGVTQLQADASWREARIDNGQDWVALGSLDSHWRGYTDGRIRAEIFDQQGPAAIALTLVSDQGQPLSVDGLVELRSSAPRHLADFLQVFAESQEPGRFVIAWHE